MRTHFILKAPKVERTKKRPVLVARPRPEPINYTAFCDGVIKRFPKVIAELAR